MGNHRPFPGTDQITVSPPWGQWHCARLDHAITGTPPQVVVTFGPLGDAGHAVLFPGCSCRSYPLCAQCLADTRHLAHTLWASAGLTLHDTG